MMRQTFQQSEAEQILQEAIRREVHSPPMSAAMPAISHERLLAMAEELGISPAALEAVLHDRQVQTEREQETTTLARLRTEFITERRAGFLPHLYSYLGVNGFLLAINVLTLRKGGDWWFIWPLLGWGLGLYFHAIASLPTRGPNFERDFAAWREKRIKRQEKEARKRAEESLQLRQADARQAAEAELEES